MTTLDICLIVFLNCLLNESLFYSFCVECDCVVVCETFICWRDHVLSSRLCVCCVSDPRVSLGVPCIYCVCVCQRSFSCLVIWVADDVCYDLSSAIISVCVPYCGAGMYVTSEDRDCDVYNGVICSNVCVIGVVLCWCVVPKIDTFAIVICFVLLRCAWPVVFSIIQIYGDRYVCDGEYDVVYDVCDELTSSFMRAVCSDQRIL